MKKVKKKQILKVWKAFEKKAKQSDVYAPTWGYLKLIILKDGSGHVSREHRTLVCFYDIKGGIKAVKKLDVSRFGKQDK